MLGRPYVYMVLAALAEIAADRALAQTPLSSMRMTLDGIIGAAIGLLVLKLARLSH